MTRLAIVSDVHADVDALCDALAQAERLGCEAVVCAGDLIDYGRFPEETIIVLREKQVPCIRGNHDRWAIERGQDDGGRVLSLATMRFLRELPTRWDATIVGMRVGAHRTRSASSISRSGGSRFTGSAMGPRLQFRGSRQASVTAVVAPDSRVAPASHGTGLARSGNDLPHREVTKSVFPHPAHAWMNLDHCLILT